MSQVLDPGVQGRVQVSRLFDAEVLRGRLDPLVPLTGHRVEFTSSLDVAVHVGLGEALGRGQELTHLILDVRGVVVDGLLLGLFLVLRDLAARAGGHLELGHTHEIADHIGLACRVVGAFLKGGREAGRGSGTDVFLLGSYLKFVLGQDLKLVGIFALILDLESHLSGGHRRGIGEAGSLANGDVNHLPGVVSLFAF